jgi:hypothetical protein
MNILYTGEVWSEKNLLSTINYVTDTPEVRYSVRMKQSVLLRTLYDLANHYTNFHINRSISEQNPMIPYCRRTIGFFYMENRLA